MQVQFSRTHIVEQFVILEQVNRLNPLQLFADLLALVFNVSNVKGPQTLLRNSSPKRGLLQCTVGHLHGHQNL